MQAEGTLTDAVMQLPTTRGAGSHRLALQIPGASADLSGVMLTVKLQAYKPLNVAS